VLLGGGGGGAQFLAHVAREVFLRGYQPVVGGGVGVDQLAELVERLAPPVGAPYISSCVSADADASGWKGRCS
jgi:hypothetical protein